MDTSTNTFKPKSYFIKNGIIDFHKDHLKKIIQRLRGSVNVLRKLKNKRGVPEWHINENYLHLFERKRKKKKSKVEKICLCEAKPQSIPLEGVNYNIMLTLNFKENLNREYYEHFAYRLFCQTNFNQCYVVEKDPEGFYHIHAAIQGDLCQTQEKSLKIIRNELGRNIPYGSDYLRVKSETYRTLVIEDMKNENAYLDYIEKHTDSLGKACLWYFKKVF